MPWVPIALSVIGTGVAVAGAAQQGAIAKQTGKYNAKLAQSQAEATDTAARETMRRSRIENRRALAQQRAGYAAAGLVADEGSPLQVQAETAAILQLNAVEEQKRSTLQSQSLLGQSSAEILYGQSRKRGANVSALGSLLSGGASVTKDYYKLNG